MQSNTVKKIKPILVHTFKTDRILWDKCAAINSMSTEQWINSVCNREALKLKFIRADLT